jgi:hypothetical protein
VRDELLPCDTPTLEVLKAEGDWTVSTGDMGEMKNDEGTTMSPAVSRTVGCAFACRPGYPARKSNPSPGDGSISYVGLLIGSSP